MGQSEPNSEGPAPSLSPGSTWAGAQPMRSHSFSCASRTFTNGTPPTPLGRSDIVSINEPERPGRALCERAHPPALRVGTGTALRLHRADRPCPGQADLEVQVPPHDQRSAMVGHHDIVGRAACHARPALYRGPLGAGRPHREFVPGEFRRRRFRMNRRTVHRHHSCGARRADAGRRRRAVPGTGERQRGTGPARCRLHLLGAGFDRGDERLRPGRRTRLDLDRAGTGVPRRAGLPRAAHRGSRAAHRRPRVRHRRGWSGRRR
jgi:hypothetical protein